MQPDKLIPYPFTYSQVDHLVNSHIAKWLNEQFQSVVAIARGGLFAASMVACTLDRPLHAVSYDRARRKVSWYSSKIPPPGAKILLVEDIAGRGTTLSDTIDFLISQGYEVKTFVLAWDNQSRIRPDYGEMVPPGYRAWFAWEREAITPAFAATHNLPSKSAHSYALWAIDLDGILTPDLPEQDYHLSLEDTLLRRDQLVLCEKLPTLDLSRTTIITGRPEQDRERTQSWLQRHNFHGELIMRNPQAFSAKDTAQHKANALLEGCYTHYIESDAEQALDIASQIPLARIFWWRQGKVQLIHASDASYYL